MTILDKRICPGCGRRPRRVHACARCGWTADPGRIPTVRELLDGAADGFIADGVDLGRFVRALLRVAHGRADEIIGALLAGPMPTAAQVRAEYDAAGLDYDAAEAKVLATIDEIDRRQKAGDNNCNTGRGPDGATE